MEIGLFLLAAAVVTASVVLALTLRRAPAPEARPDPRLDTLLSAQGNIAGQFQQTVQAQRLLSERLDALSQQLGSSLKENTDRTAETLGGIQTRLNVIDEAQKNISELSTHVVSLKAIFSDKQARGTVAQDQMESIVSDHLSPDQFEFQAKLSNGKIVDCAIRIPNVAARIVVDSKFPHEGFEALRNAETEDARKAAMVQIRSDMLKHVKDISEKYLVAGETQAPAIMFVPSDSMYAELHANFAETLKRARQSQVVLASPHVFMLVISTLQGLMRDTKMREQADMIRNEVGTMLKDVRLLGERVEKLQRHLGQADGDIKDILISRDKVVGRAERIEKVELSAADAPKALS